MRKHPETLAVIAAAGSSSRMTGTDKLFADLCGKPVLVHTLENYAHASFVDTIIVVTRKDSIQAVQELIENWHIEKIHAVIEGGPNRQISVRNALDEIGRRREEKKFKYIAIADGARCLTKPEWIDRVLTEAYRTDAASAAFPSVDTVKITDAQGYVQETPDRKNVWMAQTPQAFKYALYMAAAYSAEKDGYEATDDNALVERIEHPVKMVDVGRENLKITTLLDLVLAQAVLSFRKDQSPCESDKDMTSTD